ncbi:outer membrane lipoprotein carrier protein LolA [Streptomyces sp. NPDC087270]|uniref:LolA family protein n=1 Tax=Streptomyces sp. NPDC087270 TaxID=3365774 RepID=UPI00382B397E
MALIQPIGRPEPDEPDEPRGRGRKIARYTVPVAVAGVAVATITLVPALADAGDPSLPKITTQQLLTKIAASNTRTVDGTVKVSTDLGLPDALSGGAAGSLLSGAGGAGKSGSSSAAPQSRLAQLLVGTHQLHVSVDGPDRQKVSIIEPTAEYSVIHNGTQLWAYDSASDQAYHSALPAAAPDQQPSQLPEGVPTTPQAAAEQVLKAARGIASITVDGTARVAGRSAYELVVTPEHADTTTVGSIRIAVDSSTGVPLKFTLVPKGGGKAVFDIGFTKVGFGAPAASTFSFSPPKGVKVTEGKTSGARPGDVGNGSQNSVPGAAEPTVLGTGWDSVAVIDTGALASAGKAADSGAGFGSDGKGKAGSGPGGGDPQSLLNSYGTKVTGSFGSGTVFHTRLVNVLLTDKGKLYVGAVTQSALTAAADAAK